MIKTAPTKNRTIRQIVPFIARGTSFLGFLLSPAAIPTASVPFSKQTNQIIEKSIVEIT